MKGIKESDKIYPRSCPICGVATNAVFRVGTGKDESSMALWYQCTCGVIFQSELPSHKVYDIKYQKDYLAAKNIKSLQQHSCYTYAPIIEELTYGRMMLDVGFNLPYNMEAFDKRGWLTYGIDRNTQLEPGGNIYKGDFMTYDFSPNISKEQLKELTGESEVKRTFDLIWMSHVLEHFSDPKAALKRCFDLLSETGVLYISTPDIDFINKQGVQGWGHWKKDEHYILFSERALNREAERIGFKTVMSRRNFASRFGAWWDIHAIYQKNYF
jgi:SAM-dependent methyltransferase